MSQPKCNHNNSNWYTGPTRNVHCIDCEDEVRDDNNKIIYRGKIITLGAQATDYGPGKNPRCCEKARIVHAAFCMCAHRSYCPDHGMRCNGSHN